MYAAAVRFMIRRSVRALNRGDIKPLLNGYTRDARLVFPGASSWSGEYQGRDEIERFLTRFVDTGLQMKPIEIGVDGWPWRTSVFMRFVDEARDDEGNVVYSNRGVIWARAAWGKISRQELYEDTQKVAEFDSYLESVGRHQTTRSE